MFISSLINKYNITNLMFTDFNQDGKPDNITFMIKRIKVHTLDALKDPAYRFPNNYGVEKYLELFSGNSFYIYSITNSEGRMAHLGPIPWKLD